MLLPCEDNLLRNITLDRPAMRVGRYDVLPHDIEHALVAVFESEIALQRRLDTLKRDLEIRYDYSLLAAYRSIDKYNDGRIDTFNLGSFLRACGHYASEHELLQIVRRMDTDGDGRLNYTEFSNFVRSSYPAVKSEPVSEPRASSPLKSSAGLRSSSPVRSSPVRQSHCSPVRCSPVRHSHCSPVRCSPVRCSPVRCSPVRCPCSLCSVYPCRCCNSCTAYPCRCCSSCSIFPCSCPIRCSPVKRPILHLHEEDQLVNGLRDFIALEREVESSKVALTLKPDFNLHDAFRIFDQGHYGAISVADLRDGLAAIGVFPTSEETDLFFKRYDTGNDGRLNFHEFSQAFLA